MTDTCYICEVCRKRIGDMPIFTIPIVAPVLCDICAARLAVHAVNKRDLLWAMMNKIIGLLMEPL